MSSWSRTPGDGETGRRFLQGDQPDRLEGFSSLSLPHHPVRSVLVIGGAGYLGSSLVRALLGDGYRVRVLDTFQFGDESIRGLYGNPDFEVLQGDFGAVEPLVRATSGVDAVIHLAGVPNMPAGPAHRKKAIKANLAAASLLADVCRGAAVTRLLFASSCSVYGAAKGIVDESCEPRPVSLQATTNADSEKILLAARARDFHPVIFRLPTAFGWSYRPRFDLLVNLLTARAFTERTIMVCDSSQLRPYIAVDDVCRAFRQVLVAPVELISGETFNTGSNHMSFTLRQIVDRIAVLEPGLRVEFAGGAEPGGYRVRFDKIHGQLGFACHTTLDAGVGALREALRRGSVPDYREPIYSNYRMVSHRVRQPQRPDRLLGTPIGPQNSLWWRLNEANDGSDPLRACAAAGA